MDNELEVTIPDRIEPQLSISLQPKASKLVQGHLFPLGGCRTIYIVKVLGMWVYIKHLVSNLDV